MKASHPRNIVQELFLLNRRRRELSRQKSNSRIVINLLLTKIICTSNDPCKNLNWNIWAGLSTMNNWSAKRIRWSPLATEKLLSTAKTSSSQYRLGLVYHWKGSSMLLWILAGRNQFSIDGLRKKTRLHPIWALGRATLIGERLRLVSTCSLSNLGWTRDPWVQKSRSHLGQPRSSSCPKKYAVSLGKR